MNKLVIMLLTSAIIFVTGEGQEDVIKDYTKIMTDCVKDNQNIQNNNIEINENIDESLNAYNIIELDNENQSSLDIFNKCNEIRENNGKHKLTWNTQLKECANIRAQEISIVQSHTRPDGSDWCTINPDIMYGENLAYGYETTDEVVEAWMKSDTHRENILYDKFNSCYIAEYICNNTKYYAMEFGY